MISGEDIYSISNSKYVHIISQMQNLFIYSELSQKLIVALEALGAWGNEVYKHKHPSV